MANPPPSRSMVMVRLTSQESSASADDCTTPMSVQQEAAPDQVDIMMSPLALRKNACCPSWSPARASRSSYAPLMGSFGRSLPPPPPPLSPPVLFGGLQSDRNCAITGSAAARPASRVQTYTWPLCEVPGCCPTTTMSPPESGISAVPQATDGCWMLCTTPEAGSMTRKTASSDEAKRSPSALLSTL